MAIHATTVIALLLITTQSVLSYKITKLNPLVKTHSGLVRGFKEDVFGLTVDTFLGIPYAEPPVGKLRFMRPVPVKPWLREFRALFLPPSCVQPSVYFNRIINITGDERSEDCLYLNVWAPAPESWGPKDQLKAVMVFFHGGAFFFGSTNWHFYDGSRLAALGDVVIVTVNYRLGPLGFMNAKGRLGKPLGNQGLHDQHLAMLWVKQNIRYFGGDENTVTLFGQSAGSISIGYHLVSPSSKGLFRRAIMQSGSPYWTVGQMEKEDSFTKAAVKLRCVDRGAEEVTDFDSALSCLQEKNASDILSALQSRNGRVQLTYHPSHGDDLVPKDVPDAIRGGFVNDVDLLVGVVRDEGSVFIEYYMSPVLDFTDVSRMQKGTMDVYFMLLFRFLHQKNVQEIRDFYLETATEEPSSFLKNTSNAMGDFAFLCPLQFFAEDFARRNNSVYFYEFAHRPSYSWNAEWAGVTHFEEIPFMFGYALDNELFNITQEERALALFMMYTWTHFAKTGQVPDINGKRWPPFSASKPSYVELNLPDSQIKSPVSNGRCEFWRSRLNGENRTTTKTTTTTTTTTTAPD
ncbi:acetylcholinesterase-1-like [Haemaphysalis longicornis]